MTILPLGVCCALTLAMAFVPGGAHATKFKVIHSFAGGSDGGYPEGSLVRDKAGNFFGTTYYGGSASEGTVFRLTSKGMESVLHSFGGGADGENPAGNPTLDKTGDLYGATANGGTGGSGTVFKLAPDGTETILHSFTNGNDGGAPVGDLLIRNGKLYGITGEGGAYGAGAVFRLTTNGNETVLYSFTGGSDGYEPLAGVISDGSGNLYGTTYEGGAYVHGAVFKVSPDGTETVLHDFGNGSDGADPAGALVMDASGNLYGTTIQGGTNDAGTVFRLAPDSTENVLYSFAGGSDGADPSCALVLDAAGNLYGTTLLSQNDGVGTVFMLSPDESITVLHGFSGADGASPEAGLILDKSGNLYGTAPEGGAHGEGVVFRIRKK